VPGDESHEYLVSYGSSGGFGRFAAGPGLPCNRGERVVIESRRGLEVGVILCRATDQHVRFLPAQGGGRLLRRASDDDEQTLGQLRQKAQDLFQLCRGLARQLGLQLEILDVELLLDGQQAIIQHLAPAECDASALIAALASDHGLTVRLENLALTTDPGEEHGGCGKPDCGRIGGGGGCSSCGSGGCSACGGGKVDMRQYFAHLRSQMERHQQRTSLV
jgi:cell fate regulator YaaT (PSP1 superfamily)